MNQFLWRDFVYSRIFTNISGKIKLDTLSFLLKGPLLIAKHAKCILSFMGDSDFKIFMFKNSENKAQMNEKFLLCINRDFFKVPPQIFLLNYKRLK